MRPLELELARRVRHVPAILLEAREDDLSLRLRDLIAQRAADPRRRLAATRLHLAAEHRPHRVAADLRLASEDQEPLDGVAKLAHVPGPVVRLEERHRLLRHAL